MTTTERTPALGGDERPCANAPHCQLCGAVIEGWTCQGCGRLFSENAIGHLIADSTSPTGELKAADLPLRERLRAVESGAQCGPGAPDFGGVTNWYRNPDGPEAAALIESLSAEREGMREALEWYGEQARLARLVHSEGDAGRNALAADGGKRARAALSTQGESRQTGGVIDERTGHPTSYALPAAPTPADGGE